MTRCAICGTVLDEDGTVREVFTGSELEICEECNDKLASVKDAAREQDDDKYLSACEALMADERKGRSQAAQKLLDMYCKRCKNPDTEKERKYTNILFVTKILAVFIFIVGVAVSVLMGFVYRHVTINYMTGMSVSMDYNYMIAVFGSLAFFICSLLIVLAGEYLHHQKVRTQMLEKLYDKVFDKLSE